MGGNEWVQIGTIVAAILTLAGVIYSTRQRPEQSVVALGSAIETLGKENTRLSVRQDEMAVSLTAMRKEMAEKDRRIEVLEAGHEADAKTIAKLSAQVDILSKQVVALGGTPLKG